MRMKFINVFLVKLVDTKELKSNYEDCPILYKNIICTIMEKK